MTRIVRAASVLVALTLAAIGGASASTPTSGANAADEVVVIRSTAEAYPVGRTLSLSKDKLTLTGAQRLVLVDGQGALRRFSAPYAGPINQAAAEGANPGVASVVSVLAALLADPSRKADALRSGGGSAELPTPWAVSVEHSGPACAQTDRLTLWRRDGAKDSRLVIDMGAGGKKARANWAQGSGMLPMPASLFTSGQTYLVKVDDQEVSLVLHIAPTAAASPVETAVWMANVGCKAQALSMIDSIQ